MAELDNIVVTNEDNTGSLGRVWFIPVEDVLSIPKPIDYVIPSSIIVATDKNWFRIELTPDSPGFDDKEVKIKNSKGRSITVAGDVAGHHAGLSKLFRSMELRKFLVLAEDSEGNQRLCGSLSNPMRFKFSFDTGNKTSSFKRYSISFFQTSKESPYFYTSPFVEYPGSISPGADLITLDAYLASYLGAITARVETLEDEMDTAQEEINVLQADVITLDAEVETLQSEMDAAEADISALQADLDAAESDINTLQSDLDTAEADIINIQTDLDAAEGEIDDLQADMVTAQSDISDLQGAVAAGSTVAQPFDASAAATFPAGVATDKYRVSVAGTVQGVALEVGDTFYPKVTTPTAVAADWYVLQANGDFLNKDTDKADDTTVQAGANNTKWFSSLNLANWWTWVKANVATISGVWTFSTSPIFSSLVGDRAAYLDSSKKIQHSSVTKTELELLTGYLEQEFIPLKKIVISITSSEALNLHTVSKDMTAALVGKTIVAHSVLGKNNYGSAAYAGGVIRLKYDGGADIAEFGSSFTTATTSEKEYAEIKTKFKMLENAKVVAYASSALTLGNGDFQLVFIYREENFI